MIDDVARRIPSGWQDEGDNIYLLGVTREELDGSAWAGTIHGHLGGLPPAVDLARETRARASCCTPDPSRASSPPPTTSPTAASRRPSPRA